MQRSRFLPDPERLSVLAASILLAYALARFINIPFREFEVQFPGLFLSFNLNVQMIVTLLVACLTASGADWLLRDHPRIGHKTYEHWLLPGLTALVIGLPLLQVEPGLAWWIGFALGGFLLMIVLVAEYIVVDSQDVRQPLAASSLTVVSFALFLILAVTLRYTEIRLFFLLPALTLAIFLVSLRTLHLRNQKRWAILEALLIALLVAEWTTVTYYLPLSPVSFGMVLLGPAYALTSLLAALAEKKTIRQSILEPAVVLLLVWGLAFWIR